MNAFKQAANPPFKATTIDMSTAIVVSQTGINEIDRQHAQLLKCLDDLMAFVGGHYEFAAVFTAVQVLLDYVQQHFAYEEDLLRSWDYPDLAKHIVEHQAIETDVRNLWSQLESGDETVTEKLVQTIRQWIVKHINEEDIEYAKFRS